MFCPPFRLAVRWRRRGHGVFSRDAALKVTGFSSALLSGDGDGPGSPGLFSLCCRHVLRSGHSGKLTVGRNDRSRGAANILRNRK